MSSRRTRRNAAVVIGSAELASAIARAMHRSGFATVMCDDVDPGCMRRGMAFTDAWYVGDAQLDETTALFCGSGRSIPALLGPRDVIAATSWSWPGVLQLLEVGLVIDARTTLPGLPSPLLNRVGPGVLTLAATPWHSSRRTVHEVIVPGESAQASRTPAWPAVWDPMMRDMYRKIVVAPVAGRFTTHRQIGDDVLTGEVVGAVGRMVMYAPASGVLSGLAARGARAFAGMPVVEVDARGQPAHCFTIPTWCREVANRIAQLALDRCEAQPA